MKISGVKETSKFRPFLLFIGCIYVPPDPRVVRLLIDFLDPKLLAINNDVLLIYQTTQCSVNGSYQSRDGSGFAVPEVQ
jgi:hypothetical protein